jgi:drug/metabolite transporter (DMT)-like permease
MTMSSRTKSGEKHHTENLPLVGNGISNDGEGRLEQQGYKTNHHISMDEDDDSNSSQSHLVSGLQGRLLLLLVAFLYGSLNVSLRLVYQRPGPPSASALSSSRGWLAAACFIPLILKHNPAPIYSDVTTTQASFWRVACELALFNFGAQGLLTLGLFSTPSARASFFTQTSVVMTPILSAAAGYRIHGRVWLGCVIALVGLVLLSENSDEEFTFGFGVGDLFCLAGAFCWSLYIFRLSAVGSSFDEIRMQAAKTLILAFLYAGWFVVAQLQNDTSLWPGWTDGITWALIFYSALGPGTLADIIQQKAQAIVWAAEANVILSLEPVFTAILGLLLLGEATTWQEKIGGGLIVFASIISTSSE